MADDTRQDRRRLARVAAAGRDAVGRIITLLVVLLVPGSVVPVHSYQTLIDRSSVLVVTVLSRMQCSQCKLHPSLWTYTHLTCLLISTYRVLRLRAAAAPATNGSSLLLKIFI